MNDQVLAAASMLVSAAATLAIVGFPVLAVSKGRQMIDTVARFQNDASAIAAVAAVRAPQRNVFFASKAHAPAAAAARFQLNLNSINKHTRADVIRIKIPSPSFQTASNLTIRGLSQKTTIFSCLPQSAPRPRRLGGNPPFTCR